MKDDWSRHSTLMKLIVGSMLSALLTFAVALSTSSASSISAAPKCADTQLAAAAEAWGGAGGSDGFTVLISNQSRKSCTIDGFASVEFFGAKGQRIRAKAVRGEGSMLYDAEKPKDIDLAPDTVASFAVSFNGAFASPHESPAACDATTMSLELPTIHPRFYPNNVFIVPTSLDLCGSDWTVGVTPIEYGPRVKGP
jgi:hypothetical protein